MSYDAMASAGGYGHDAGSWASDADKCDCSVGWRWFKGHGPDPAKCPIHGDPARLAAQRPTPAPTEES